MNYEEFLKLIQSRRSIRRFSEQPVNRKDLLRVLAAACWAPSNHNRQPWKFIVFEDRQRIINLAVTVRESLSEKLKSLPAIASGYADEFVRYATFFSEAPVLLVALHKRPVSVSNALLDGVRQPELVSGEPLSVAMAVQNLLLAAHTLRLGTCVLTAPLIDREVIGNELSLPAGYGITCFVALGCPGETPPPPRRKSIEQIVEFRNDRPGMETT